MAEKKSGWGLRLKLPGATAWRDALDYRTKKPYYFADWSEACRLKLKFEAAGVAAEIEPRQPPTDDDKPPGGTQGSLF